MNRYYNRHYKNRVDHYDGIYEGFKGRNGKRVATAGTPAQSEPRYSIDSNDIIESLCKAYALSYMLIKGESSSVIMDDDLMDTSDIEVYKKLCKDIMTSLVNICGKSSTELLLRSAINNMKREYGPRHISFA